MSATETQPSRAPSFSPDLRPADPCAAYWLRQVTLRLRREVAWLWRERGLAPASAEALPPTTDRAVASLDLARYRDAKRAFFATDETGAYLTEQLAASPPEPAESPVRGSFGWVARELGMDSPERFVLALALSVTYDSAVGSVLAACANDPGATRPTLGLAQRLWDDPDAVLRAAEPGHPLFAHGLVRWATPPGSATAGIDWDRPFQAPVPVAAQLVAADERMPPALRPMESDERPPADDAAAVLASRLRAGEADRLRVVPVVARRGSEPGDTAARVSGAAGRRAVAVRDPVALGSRETLSDLAAFCWLRDLDLFLEPMASADVAAGGGDSAAPALPLASIPVNVYLAVADARDAGRLPPALALPALDVPRLSYAERVALWRDGLGESADRLQDAIRECAGRFRFERRTIEGICRHLASGDDVGEAELTAACRAEVRLDMGELAEEVTPRFDWDELVLPPPQKRQLDEIRRAMGALRRVHYEWGTAEAWNEAGVSALFAGPPGTGKTMASEVLARSLDPPLPLYQVDLSQVVDKYIGETEKRLKRVFDACDACDVVLVINEADVLYGRRTAVRDAHDRYANLEVSYLLGRMERARGLTILTTNRKDDLDEAFLRRLRYIVDFPRPAAEERRAIWDRVLPDDVDVTDVDTSFLADRFPLTGGHIHSAVFNACLQSAARTNGTGGGHPPRLRMADVLISIRRELQKSDRAIALEQFGPYAPVIEALDRPDGHDADGGNHP